MSQTRADDEEVDILAVAGAVWRGRWLILLCSIIAIAIGGYYAFFVAVPKYASSTALALQLRSESVVDIESVLTGVSTESAAMNTELEVIKSRGLLKKLVIEMDLVNDPEFNAALRTEPKVSVAKLKVWTKSMLGIAEPEVVNDPEADAIVTTDRVIDTVRRVITATNQKNTYVFIIRATTETPKKSASIANTLAKLYIQDQIAVKFQATENAFTWLSERVSALEIELEEKEYAIKTLQGEMSLVNAEALEGLSQRVRDLRSRLNTARDDVGAGELQLVRIEALQSQGDLSALVQELDDIALTRLFAEFQNGRLDSPSLIDSRAKTIVAQLRTQQTRAEQQVEILAGSLLELDAQLANQSEQLIKLQQLQRDTEASRTLYETFLARLKETSVQRGLQQADSRVLSEATPGLYLSPRKSRILLTSMILGIMAGILISLARQFLHSGIRSLAELESVTGVKALGQIPRMPLRKRGQLLDYLNTSSTSATVEAIRDLRTSLLLSDSSRPAQLIMFTSAVPGDGKTTMALAFAHNLAGLGKRVILVDCDIRRRTFDEYFKNPQGKHGWTKILTGDCSIEEATFYDERMGVDILMGEKTKMNAADVFSSEAFKQLLEALRERYDYIVLDTPPVLVVPDARIISQLVDRIAFNVAWDKTDRKQVAEAVRQLSLVDSSIIGVVLSQVSIKGMKRYGYYGQYGSYKSYYDR